MRLKHRIEYGCVRAVQTAVGCLPRPAALFLADRMGDLWFLLDVRRRRRALRSLELALGKMPTARRRRIARQAQRNLARAVLEVLDLERWNKKRFAELVTIEGWQHIQAAYQSGRGVLLFSGHVGCWELVPHLQALYGLPLHMVVRPLNNPELDGLLRRLRESSGNRTVPKRNAIRNILRALKDGEGAAIVIDQNLRSEERIFVDFFGRPAATTPALALLAQRTGAVIIPVFCLPRPDGHWLVRYLPPVELPDTGDRRRDTWELTQTCTRIIENVVREEPASWLWVHRRWRTRPGPGEYPPDSLGNPEGLAVSG